MIADTTRPKFRRRFAWLSAGIFSAVVLYTAGWFHVAGLIDDEANEAIAAVGRSGVRLRCENNEVRGYPFRLGLNCDSVDFEYPSLGVRFTAGAFRSAAQFYNPAFLVGELDGIARLAVDGLPPLAFNWEILRASVRLADPLPSRVSVETRQFAAVLGAEEAKIRKLFTAKNLEAHMRPNGAAIDLAASVSGLLVDRALVEGRKFPALNGGIDIEIENGGRWATSARKSLRGQSGRVRQIYLSPGHDGAIRAHGRFSVDTEGLIDAELVITVIGTEFLAETAKAAFPEAENRIAGFMASLDALEKDARLPLRVVDGAISYGFIELGRIPPLP